MHRLRNETFEKYQVADYGLSSELSHEVLHGIFNEMYYNLNDISTHQAFNTTTASCGRGRTTSLVNIMVYVATTILVNGVRCARTAHEIQERWGVTRPRVRSFPTQVYNSFGCTPW